MASVSPLPNDRLRTWAASLESRLTLIAWHFGRTGVAGLLGLALLAASVVFYLSTHRPVLTETADLRAQVAEARRHPVNRAARSDDAQTVVAKLPARDDVPDLLGEIVSAAAANNLSLDTGKYDVTATKSGQITRYKASLPVSGAYPQLRAFIGDVLTRLPNAGISELAFERKGVGEPVVESQIRLVLYTRSKP